MVITTITRIFPPVFFGHLGVPDCAVLDTLSDICFAIWDVGRHDEIALKKSPVIFPPSDTCCSFFCVLHNSYIVVSPKNHHTIGRLSFRMKGYFLVATWHHDSKTGANLQPQVSDVSMFFSSRLSMAMVEKSCLKKQWWKIITWDTAGLPMIQFLGWKMHLKKII